MLHVQYYIFAGDQTGNLIFTALEKAAHRGVNVYVVVDAFGSSDFQRKFGSRAATAGIHFREFGRWRIGKRMQSGRRMHHKVVVADHETLLVGGINVADKYMGVGAAPWLDYAVLVKGGIAQDAHAFCEALFAKKHLTLRRMKGDNWLVSTPRAEVRICRNDWLWGRSEISRSYLEAVTMARQNVYIIASYFLPGRKIKKRIQEAAARGADVRFLMASESDIPFMKGASRYLYRWMFRYGMRVYEYQPGMVHGKVAMADDYWLTIGSYNLNNLSDLGSLELNVEMQSQPLASEWKDHFLDLLESRSVEIKPEMNMRFRWLTAMVDWLSYQVMKGAERFLLRLTGRKENNAS